jgi:predicted ester cyclase
MMENNSMNKVMNTYFKVKNALAKDDAKAAATAGNEVVAAITNVDVTGFNEAQKKMYEEVKPEIKEHAEHISSNGDEIAHQREHFETMSKDLYDLVKVSGTSQTMYYTHCPMYNNNKGASWLSEVKEIRNPYLGKKMPDCGTIKEVLK